MIISASRRTDVPAFYSGWLVGRLNAGYCLVKNPFNPTQIKRVSLLPKDVDGIVLWTKNAAPLLPKISELDNFSYYFQYSITPYHAESLLHIAKKHGIMLCACCELPGLYELGVQSISCVDASLFGMNSPRDKNQRAGCNCAVSVDIGAYNSCMNGCRYCYANHNDMTVRNNYAEHNADLELMV